MSKKSLVPKLPEPDRQERLGSFLTVLDQDPNLAHFRSAVRTGPERQLALIAALERAVAAGTPAAAPPHPDDDADQLLCDILDVVDHHPELKEFGSHYGPQRHLVNLQAFGLWRGTEPVAKPTARELFTTSFSRLTAGSTSDLHALDMNTSPASQVFSPNGEVFALGTAAPASAHSATEPPQTVDGVLVLSIAAGQSGNSQSSENARIVHQADSQGGEEKKDAAADTHFVPARPVRRGQPRKIDDLAKGRLLGLMSYGLSFRQAAAQLGVHHVTILNTLKRDEEFAQQVAEARLDAISQPLLTVVHASRTSWRAAAWLAKFLSDRRASNYESTPEERVLERMRQQ